eukprot:gene4522-3309_t
MIQSSRIQRSFSYSFMKLNRCYTHEKIQQHKYNKFTEKEKELLASVAETDILTPKRDYNCEHILRTAACPNPHLFTTAIFASKKNIKMSEAPRSEVDDTAMVNIIDKLRLLNYESDFCQSVKPPLPLTRFYFAGPSSIDNPNTQFFYFTSLCSWLMGICGHNFAPPGQFDDPNATATTIIAELQTMNVSIGNVAPNRLKQGSGEGVTIILSALIDEALKRSGFKFPAIDYSGLEKYDEMNDVAEGIEDEDAGGEIEDNVVIDSDDDEEVFVRGADREKDNNGIPISSDINADEWNLEVEHVAPMLQVRDDLVDDWRSRVESATVLLKAVEKMYPEVKSMLERMVGEMDKARDRIKKREQTLAQQFAEQVEDYRVKLRELNTSRDQANIANQSVQQLTVELNQVSEILDQTKKDSEEREARLSDTTPLMQVKEAVVKVRNEIKQMELRIGILQHGVLHYIKIQIKNKETKNINEGNTQVSLFEYGENEIKQTAPAKKGSKKGGKRKLSDVPEPPHELMISKITVESKRQDFLKLIEQYIELIVAADYRQRTGHVDDFIINEVDDFPTLQVGYLARAVGLNVSNSQVLDIVSIVENDDPSGGYVLQDRLKLVLVDALMTGMIGGPKLFENCLIPQTRSRIIQPSYCNRLSVILIDRNRRFFFFLCCCCYFRGLVLNHKLMMRRFSARSAGRISSAPAARLFSSYGGRRISTPSSALLQGLQQPQRFSGASQDRARGAQPLTSNSTSEPRFESQKISTEETQPRNNTTSAADELDQFSSIRNHKFFDRIINRVEREIPVKVSSCETYSKETISELIRPLLQFADKTFTVEDLHKLIPKINVAALENTLRSVASQRNLNIFYSQQFGTVLDWSLEDFLRRRYESIHLSWEPMDVVEKRLGWGPDAISPSDILLYFSKFGDLVELARLEVVGGKPKALPIRNSVELARRGGLSLSQLLIRRKPAAETEPSLTESIRLMGSPSLCAPSKSKKQRRTPTRDSVTGVFEAIEHAADTAPVEGSNPNDRNMRLQKAAEGVAGTRQAQHPAGRIIKEFSIGKIDPPSCADKNCPGDADEADTAPEAFNQYQYDSLCGAYHRRKVEISLLRRRISNMSSTDQIEVLQERLSKSRKELSALGEQLKHMRELKNTRIESVTNHGAGNGSFVSQERSDDYDSPVAREREGVHTPQASSQASKNDSAAAEDDNDVEEEGQLEGVAEEEELEEDAFSEKATQEDRTAVPCATTAPIETNKAEKDSAAAELAAWAVKEFEDDEIEQQQLAAKAARGVTVMTEEDADDDDTMLELERAEEELELEAHTHIPSPPDEKAEMSEAEELQSSDEEVGETPADVMACRRLEDEEEQLRLKIESTRRQLEETSLEWKELEMKMKRALDLHTVRLAEFEKELQVMRDREMEVRASKLSEKQDEEHQALKAAEERARIAEEKLNSQREAAKQANELAHKAMQRQLEAEQAAKEMEEELEAKREKLQTQMDAVAQASGVPEPPSSRNSSLAHTAATPAAKGAKAKKGAVEEGNSLPTRRAESTYTVSDFMCTPEQYDGLHLAAKRLRREIATLEKEMEEGDAEDDETLMSVLAASRADLEELEECISSVQQNADWAAASDAIREQEEEERLKNFSPAARQIQEEIETHNFNLTLLEKRLHVASQRGVINKLEQRIVHARREVARLRREQDRLRRSGDGDGFGVPHSISIAETLGKAEKADAATPQLDAAEDLPYEEASLAAEPAEENTESTTASDTTVAVEKTETPSSDPALSIDYQSELEEITGGLFSGDAYGAHAETTIDLTEEDEMGYEEAERLKGHLDNMVNDIQNLQRTISSREGSSDEETESVLNDLREKLEQLVQIREDVERRLAAEVVSDPPTSSTRTPLTTVSINAPTSSTVAENISSRTPQTRSGMITKKRAAASLFYDLFYFTFFLEGLLFLILFSLLYHSTRQIISDYK